MLTRQRLWEVLEARRGGDRLSRGFDAFMVALILVNTVAVVLETVAELSAAYGPLFQNFETFSVAVFTTEYAMRLLACTADPRYARPLTGRLRYARTPLALVDLAAIAPFFLPFVGIDLRHLRLLRMVRLLRIMKLARYSRAVASIGRVVTERRGELVATIGIAATAVLLSATLLYHVENDAQPDKFGSIPATMWWAAATLTTVGYGDVYPVTPVGKVLGALVAAFGVSLFALPSGVVAAAFLEEMRGQGKPPASAAQARRPTRCPHCGGALDGEAPLEEVGTGGG